MQFQAVSAAIILFIVKTAIYKPNPYKCFLM